jgi:hypothetical protein
MKYWIVTAGFLAATAQMAAPAHAFGMSFEQVMCPLEKLGEAEGEALSKAFVILDDSSAFDAQMEKLHQAINSCAGEHSWANADSQFALDFTMALVAGVATEEKLASFDIVASDFDTWLDDGGPTDWQKLADDPENSELMQAAIDQLVVEKGDSATEEISGYLGAYLVSVAKSRLLALELIDNGGM